MSAASSVSRPIPTAEIRRSADPAGCAADRDHAIEAGHGQSRGTLVLPEEAALAIDEDQGRIRLHVQRLLERLAGARDFLVAPRFRQHAGYRLIAVDGFMMEQAQMPCTGHLAQLDGDDIARMAPVRLDRDRVGQRVHCIEYDHIGIAKELDEGARLRKVGQVVLGVGGVDHGPARRSEAISVRISGVPLEHEANRQSRDLVFASGLQANEFDVRAQRGKIHGERRCAVLSPQSLLESGVPAIDAEPVAFEIGGGEKRKPHDVVPMHVGHEDVIRLRRSRVARHGLLAEGAHAAAEVAEDVLGTSRFDLDARAVTAIGAGHGDIEAVDIGIELTVRCKGAPGRAAQRSHYLLADLGRGEGDRQRSAGAPETDAFHGSDASWAAAAAGENFCSAARTDGNASRTCLKRAMSKISSTTGCSAATPMGALPARSCLAAIIRTRRPMLLM